MVLPAGYSISTTWPVFLTASGASLYWKVNAAVLTLVVEELSILMGVCLIPTSTNVFPDLAPHVAKVEESCPQNEGPIFDFTAWFHTTGASASAARPMPMTSSAGTRASLIALMPMERDLIGIMRLPLRDLTDLRHSLKG